MVILPLTATHPPPRVSDYKLEYLRPRGISDTYATSFLKSLMRCLYPYLVFSFLTNSLSTLAFRT